MAVVTDEAKVKIVKDWAFFQDVESDTACSGAPSLDAVVWPHNREIAEIVFVSSQIV